MACILYFLRVEEKLMGFFLMKLWIADHANDGPEVEFVLFGFKPWKTFVSLSNVLLNFYLDSLLWIESTLHVLKIALWSEICLFKHLMFPTPLIRSGVEINPRKSFMVRRKICVISRWIFLFSNCPPNLNPWQNFNELWRLKFESV